MLFTFTNEQGDARADEIVDHLRGPRLWVPRTDYPDYDGWLTKVHAQLRSAQKRAMLALDRGTVVGAIVYQRHLADPTLLEVKNISVRPDARGRHVASFLLRNVEVESLHDYPGVHAVTVDAKKDNVGMRLFLLQNRYIVKSTQDLYGLGAGDDLVFHRPLSKRDSPF